MERSGPRREEVVRVRLSAEEAALLRRVEQESGRSKSDILREGIQRLARDRAFARWLQDASAQKGKPRRREPTFLGK